MKKILLLWLGCMLFGMVVLPSLLARGCEIAVRRPPQTVVPVSITLYSHASQSIIRMPLEEYLIGVLAAEMPASFHPEALKAQAMVARTYAIRRMKAFGGKGASCHPDADICDDPAHGQAWLSEKQAKARWSILTASRNWSALASAVQSTAGQILTHKGLPIDPVYHSTCGGQTENSEDVWQESLPYLRSVECKWCSTSPKIAQTVEITTDELARRLGERTGAITAMAQKEGRKVIEVLKASQTGRVQSLRVGTTTLKGTEFRSALSLPSTRFGWQVIGNRVRFEVSGFGHGVGMCQYGANNMAKDGWKAEQIVSYYFTGVTVAPMFQSR